MNWKTVWKQTVCAQNSHRSYFLRRTIKLYLISQIAALFCKTCNRVIDWQCLSSVFLGNTSFMKKNAILRICSSPCFSNMKIFRIDTGRGKDTRKIPKHLSSLSQQLYSWFKKGSWSIWAETLQSTYLSWYVCIICIQFNSTKLVCRGSFISKD